MTSDRRSLLLAVLGLVLLAALGFDAARKFSVDASMDHFLPGQGERKLYRVSRKLIDSTLTESMVLTIGLESRDKSRLERRAILGAATKSFAQALRDIEGVATVTEGPPEGIEKAFFDLYFPRRFAFYSLQPEEDAPSRFNDAHLESDARRLKEKLGSPEGVFLRNLAPRDPWLLFSDFLSRAESSALRLDIHEGSFFARPTSDGRTGAGPDEDFAVLFLQLADSALDGTAQAPLLAQMDEATKRLQTKEQAQLVVEMSGANRFAVATERSMKGDIQRVFSLSTAGLLLLFLAFFRSLRRVLFLVIPIAAGLVGALWTTLTVYGQVHALTLAFGGALIGIAIDYPVHTLCHHDLEKEASSGRSTLRRLWPTLALAAGTTIAGLLGLGWASFPGIREIALFSGVGVTTALLATSLGTNLLAPRKNTPALSKATAAALTSGLARLQENRLIPWLLIGLALLAAVAGGRLIRFAPGLESLAPLDPDLLAEDARVQARVGEVGGGTLAIALGETPEQALERNERSAVALARARADGLLASYENVSVLLRSVDLQQRAHESVTKIPRLKDRTWKALEKEGFVPQAFKGIEEELEGKFTPLTLAQLEKSPLASLVKPFVFPVGSETAVISPLSDVEDYEELDRRLSKIPGVHLFSQKALLNQAYSDLRVRTTELLLLGLLFVFLAALLRYRKLTKALALLLPAVLASGATIGILALLGVELNILHMLGLLLVCSMGVDYAVFLIDSGRENPGPALLSIALGCVSTMFSFGALSLSSAPALAALGTTISLGIVLSLVLAPTAFVLLPVSERESNPRAANP